MNSRKNEYSDDIFAATRMSFGDHLDELRYRMWAALKAMLAVLILAFVLDALGPRVEKWTGWKNFGIGKPAMELIKAPVEDQMNLFYDERAWSAVESIKGEPKTAEETKKRTEEKNDFLENCRKTRKASSEEINKPLPLRVQINRDELRKATEGTEAGDAELTLNVPPVDLALLTRLAQERVGKRNQLASMGAAETFIIYFKVTLMCGFILASPVIFYQFWAFVGAGLYPHEKRYVHVYLPFSVCLFIAGVVLCFAWVLPGALNYFLTFNEWFDVDPDFRLKEWLGFATMLPLVFGISFQTPLVMLFLSRLGMFGWDDYLAKWRYAVMVLALFAAVITPTPDAVTMMYLFVPMFGLYMLGILLCYLTVQPHEREAEEAANTEEIAV